MLQLSCKTGGSEFNAYLSYRANEPMLHQLNHVLNEHKYLVKMMPLIQPVWFVYLMN